jgi:predicted RNA methylase
MYDAGYKGYYRAFFETMDEVVNKRRLKKLGVIHPDLSVNVEATKARSLNKDAHENQPSSFYMLGKTFRRIKLNYQDCSMLDIGCGTGRVLTFGMLLGFKRVMGIDLDEEGIKQAITNCNMMEKNGHNTTFDVRVADACHLTIPGDVSLIYMFNPFGGKTMETVLENIIAHVKSHKKELHVIYSNPTQKALFENRDEVTKINESFFKNGKADVAIYKINYE